MTKRDRTFILAAIASSIILWLVTAGLLAVIYWQQRAIDAIIADQQVTMQIQDLTVKVMENLTARVRELEARPAEFRARLEKVEKQQDLMTAAARMGWKQAYRFVREGGLE